MNSLLHRYMNFNSSIEINFEGGELTSDAGLLLYRDFDEKLGFTSCLKQHLIMDSDAYCRLHSSSSLAIQKIYQCLAGYFNDSCANELINDPLLKAVLEKESLASQATLSRFNNSLTSETITIFEEICRILQERIHNYEKPEQMILDIDSTHFDTYGNQEKSDYNAHYQTTGFHPLVMFDGLTGDLIKAELRAGNVYTSNNVVNFMQPVLEHYNKNHSEMLLYVRADSGFAVPELYDLIESNHYQYAIRLKLNKSLIKLAECYTEDLMKLCQEDLVSYKCIYGEIDYKASSWSKARKVAVKIEKPYGQMTPIYTFIVSNMNLSAKEIIKFYCNRGTMENFIKEGKMGFSFDKMSSTSFIVNSNKLQISVLAYNFNNWFRRLCMKNHIKSFRMDTIRNKVIKVAAKIVRHARKIAFKLCSSYPYKNVFIEIINALYVLPKLE